MIPPRASMHSSIEPSTYLEDRPRAPTINHEKKVFLVLFRV